MHYVTATLVDSKRCPSFVADLTHAALASVPVTNGNFTISQHRVYPVLPSSDGLCLRFSLILAWSTLHIIAVVATAVSFFPIILLATKLDHLSFVVNCP